MIQRAQTIMDDFAAIAVFLTIKFSFYSGTLALQNTADAVTSIDNDEHHLVTATDNFLLLILTSALGTGIIINIFLFKHRSIQIRIIIVAILAECLIVYIYIWKRKNFPGKF